MRLRHFQSILYGLMLTVSSGLLADSAADQLVEEVFSIYYSPLTLTSKPAVGNLQKYTVKFSDPTVPTQKAYVDNEGQYILLGNKINTTPFAIQFYRNHFQPLPSESSIFNFDAYIYQGAPLFDEQKDTPHSLKRIIYIDKANRYAVIGGGIIDNTFNNVSFVEADTLIHNDEADFIYEKCKKLGWFMQGDPKAPRHLYAFIEPNCEFCHEFYTQIKPFIDAGQVSVRWLLITFISPDSRGKAFAILDGAVPPGANYPHTPVGALNYNEDNFVFIPGPTPDDPALVESGGIPPISDPSKKAISFVNENEQFAFTYFNVSTPFLVYRNLTGQPDYQAGTEDINAFVNNLFVH